MLLNYFQALSKNKTALNITTFAGIPFFYTAACKEGTQGCVSISIHLVSERIQRFPAQSASRLRTRHAPCSPTIFARLLLTYLQLVHEAANLHRCLRRIEMDSACNKKILQLRYRYPSRILESESTFSALVPTSQSLPKMSSLMAASISPSDEPGMILPQQYPRPLHS